MEKLCGIIWWKNIEETLCDKIQLNNCLDIKNKVKKFYGKISWKNWDENWAKEVHGKFGGKLQGNSVEKLG